MLARELYSISRNNPPDSRIYLEDESQRIGVINLPTPFWNQMRSSPIQFFDIPFEDRLDYLTLTYGKFEKEELVNGIMRIQKRLAGLETKNAISYLIANDCRECFRQPVPHQAQRLRRSQYCSCTQVAREATEVTESGARNSRCFTNFAQAPLILNTKVAFEKEQERKKVAT